ncbi:hypothetical protein CRUP_029069 [Coryphaenoides rupestris]|nr:hypothetical protein CRUP_029069 [Coryphaenoides rupestris]
MRNAAVVLVVVVVLVVLGGPGPSGAMPGGFSKVDVSDPGVSAALQFAVSQHNQRTNDMFVHQVSRVISAERQVVNGLNYRFILEMGTTACRKDGVETECLVHLNPEDAQVQVCTFKVYRNWTDGVSVGDCDDRHHSKTTSCLRQTANALALGQRCQLAHRPIRAENRGQ